MIRTTIRVSNRVKDTCKALTPMLFNSERIGQVSLKELSFPRAKLCFRPATLLYIGCTFGLRAKLRHSVARS